MSVTIKDIASRTGVSMATVSRVINNSGYVSSEKRKLVEEAIAEFNFVPSAMAKGLSRQNSNMVGALIPEIDNPFFSGVIHGITEVCDKKNLNLILCSTNESPEREQRFVRALREQRICGLIVASSVEEAYQNTDYAEIFQNMDCPVVLIDRNILWSDLDGVFTEDAGAMTELVSCLLNEGHRHIEYLAGSLNAGSGKKRLQGFYQAFSDHGVPCQESWIHPSPYSSTEGYRIVQEILSGPRAQWPSAIVTSNNRLSMGALKSLSEHQLQIPDDIAFGGYDQLEIMEFLSGNLTLLEKDNAEIGRLAMQMLYERMNETEASHRRSVIVHPHLVIRGSEKFPKNREQQA